jgi:hypothetical protein
MSNVYNSFLDSDSRFDQTGLENDGNRIFVKKLNGKIGKT